MANKINLEQKFYCVVTGASKGIGQAIAQKLASKFKSGSVIVLLARSLKGLEVTKSFILAINPSISVVTTEIDLSKPNYEAFQKNLESSVQGLSMQSFDATMIVHNVGSVGDVTKRVSELNNLNYWQEYYALNVFGVALLNSAFLKFVGPTHNIQCDVYKTIIINITSLIAIKPFANMGHYGTGKAAREMLFKVLAEEEKYVLVLNYSPGPVKTDMIQIIIKDIGDASIKQTFETMRDEDKILTTDQTTSKLLEILQNGNFTSGDHIDYFD
ncbi:sepiapterin reductase [Ctenocephalides felis]|uniref:sepiapterin reductase n=1 Tax=Ctenocephalides felis TaxID=7515 RepID=UPI000E6E577C|nr:sepiapterin reductase [Ctenocephalides felis]